mmetsp:Transcript_74304/g.179499  ORF Transcript_74304/g.179499 Transcript_74304/m.179499 type:complete len:230 (-) Transcript_74304:725-1414(-)
MPYAVAATIVEGPWPQALEWGELPEGNPGRRRSRPARRGGWAAAVRGRQAWPGRLTSAAGGGMRRRPWPRPRRRRPAAPVKLTVAARWRPSSLDARAPARRERRFPGKRRGQSRCAASLGGSRRQTGGRARTNSSQRRRCRTGPTTIARHSKRGAARAQMRGTVHSRRRRRPRSRGRSACTAARRHWPSRPWPSPSCGAPSNPGRRGATRCWRSRCAASAGHRARRGGY